MTAESVGSLSRRRLVLECAVVAVLATWACATLILGANELFTIDGFYHYRIVREMAAHGPVVDIEWLPLTILGEHGPDHHWFWHLLFVPLAWVLSPEAGLRWALILNAVIVPVAIHGVVRTLGIRWPWLWTLLALGGGTSLVSRLLMFRAQNLAIVLLLLALVLIVRRRPLALAVLAFVFLQAYHGALILLVPVGFHWVGARLLEKRWEWKLPLAVAAGFGAALLLNPWFPRNVEYLWFHTTFKLLNEQQLRVGTEWVRTPWVVLLREAWPVHLALVAGIVEAMRRRSRSATSLAMVATSATLFVMYHFAHRFAEYYVPVGIITGAFLLREAMSRWTAWRIPVVVTALAALGLWRMDAGLGVYQEHAKSRLDVHEKTVETLRQVAPPGSLIFNVHWDDFPYLLWWSTDFRYVNGLDPHYLAYRDRERFEVWASLTGETRPPADPIAAILEGLGTPWVVLRATDVRYHQFLRQDPRAALIGANEWGFVYRLSTAAKSRAADDAAKPED